MTAAWCSPVPSAGQQIRAITVEDCVRTRRPVPGEVTLSPDGKRIAYIVKAPNLTKNRNDYRVYVRDIKSATQRNNGSLLFVANDVSGLTWLSDNSRIVFLSRTEHDNIIRIVNVVKRTSTIAAASRRRIGSFSINSDGRALAFSVSLPTEDPVLLKSRTLRGFPVKFGTPIETWDREDWSPNSSIYIVRTAPTGNRTVRRVCSKTISISNDSCTLPSVTAVSLSLRGEFLTFNFRATHVPEHWKTNLVYKWLSEGGIPIDALALYDVQRGEVRIAFDTPDAGFEQPAIWSGDGRLFTIVSLAPARSRWEREDALAGFTNAQQMESYTHLFAVDPRNGDVSQVLKSLTVWSQNPTLFWKSSTSPLLVRNGKEAFAWMSREGGSWIEQAGFTPVFEGFGVRPSATSTGSTVASNGEVVVGVAEATMSPPEILKYDVRSKQSVLLSDLNPEYRGIALGQVEPLQWKSSLGADCSGYLIKPVGYSLGKKYPLVIMAKGWTDGFLSDTRFQTAFPPQPLANDGFAVLLINMPAGGSELKEYPSGAAEALNWIAMVESGVTLVNERGLIDKGNVGIIGFSRTSWNVDFMITHSDIHFAAASSADSGLYNYGSYWYDNNKDSIQSNEQAMGGPPYGETLQHWIKYSPAFNAQNAHVPLLMEYCGYGVLSQPLSALEFFVALSRQAKPVELYFYPKGEHMLDTPWERVASLQRNVDWFRFWMQGFERAHPEDHEQYIRWEALRKLHSEDVKKLAGDKTKSGESNF
jgi:dipeptidyl aminopeptidase/acylaminoacyl peptidase